MQQETQSRRETLPQLVRMAFGFALTLCGVCFLYVAWQGFYDTCWLVSEEVTGYFRSDVVFQTALLLLACLVLWTVTHWVHKLHWERFVLPAVLVCSFGAGLFWIWAAGVSTAWEPWICGRIAETAMQQDWFLFRPEEYLSMFPFQSGFVAYLELIYTVCGGRNDIAVSIVGLFWLLAGQAALYFLAGRVSPHPRAKTLTALLLVSAWPWVLYVTFNYGTYPSASAALCASALLLRFLDAPSVGRFVPAALLFGVAMLLKNSALIPLIAACIVLVLVCVERRLWKWLVAVPLLCAIAFGAPTAAQKWYEARSGQAFVGTPLLVWIAMGLEDGEMMAPGWFNGKTYNALRIADMDPALCAQQQKDDIAARVQTFLSDSAYTKSFFMRKINSMWLDPTFGAFYFSMAKETRAEENMPALTNYLRTRTQDNLSIYFFDALQTLVYGGAVLGLFSLTLRTSAAGRLRFGTHAGAALLAIMALGGFLYLLVSEGKSQYAFSYYILLLPYAAHGLCTAWHGALLLWRRAKKWRKGTG